MSDDDRVRGCFRYHGASPGRFTSLGIQMQNLKRPGVKDLAAAIEAVGTGDLDHLRSRLSAADVGASAISPAPWSARLRAVD